MHQLAGESSCNLLRRSIRLVKCGFPPSSSICFNNLQNKKEKQYNLDLLCFCLKYLIRNDDKCVKESFACFKKVECRNGCLSIISFANAQALNCNYCEHESFSLLT